MSRRAFLGSSSALLAACGGGATVGSAPPGSVARPGGSPTPGVTNPPSSPPSSSASPTATPTGATSTAAAFPNGTVSINNRTPNSLPDASRLPGQADPTLPFDYVVVIMMENHSFDNYFGMLPVRGQPLADGFTFDASGKPIDRNPLGSGYQHVFHLPGTCQPNGVSQAWSATRHQIDNGAMDGFPATDLEAMGYFDQSDIPFYYSLANTFCVGNRSYACATVQTYPNHRFLLSGTSQGYIATNNASLMGPAPANGTLMDVMSKYGVTWKNYFVDLPGVAIIPQNVTNHPQNFASSAQFFADCAAGTLPSVSFVDPEFGATDDVGGALFPYLQGVPNLPPVIAAGVNNVAAKFNSQGGDEENPQDIAIGENYVSRVINAVLRSPLWPRTLLIWTYDEHGGYYDHVTPAAAVEPDDILPMLSPSDPPGRFNITGLRVPTVVVSPYSKPHGVSNVPHDHTAIIATIAAKWNLPALTYRDAQSPTLFDYVDFKRPPALLTPPTLAAPGPIAGVGPQCPTQSPPPVITPAAKRR